MSDSIPSVTLVINAKSPNFNSLINFDVVVPLFYINETLSSNQYTRSFMANLLVKRKKVESGNALKKHNELIQKIVDDLFVFQKKLQTKHQIETLVKGVIATQRERLPIGSAKEDLISLHAPNRGTPTALYPAILSNEELDNLAILNKLPTTIEQLVIDVSEAAYVNDYKSSKPYEHNPDNDVVIPFQPDTNMLIKSFSAKVQQVVNGLACIPAELTKTYTLYINGHEIKEDRYAPVIPVKVCDQNISFAAITPII